MTTPLNAEQLKATAAEHLMPNYGVRNIVLERGKGSRVWDVEGREYLDFLSGISVNNLGHCPDSVITAIQRQVADFMHCSNLYLIPQQVELARRLCELCFADKVFFANSGAEVNEGAIKLARLYSLTKHGEGRHEIITVRNSFHGRTIATITATGQEKIQKGFAPLVDGFKYAEFNNLDSVKALVSKATCAVMIEPVQGEGGVTPATQEFMAGLRELCNANNLLLIFDEIQCGMARCGRMFAHQVYDVEPDIMTLAKALGNGMPIGALLARAEVADVFQPGSHGSTFGGNPIACAAGLAVLDEMRDSDIPQRSFDIGKHFRERLQQKLSGHKIVKEVRGLGLMVGIELTVAGAEAVTALLERGIIINCTMGNVLRILPPLTVSKEDCDFVVDALNEILTTMSADESGKA